MTQNHEINKKKKFDNEELEWAISLMEKEYNKDERNTPHKMAELISRDFDVECTSFEVTRFFESKENYELESKIIENYEKEISSS